ncbi:MAG TPA: PaaI family thioesterase [Leptospiraceae bacterium]|nr:PaaI family thioesterase [Leptospiraceae bacterium]HMW05647.1 PaaI family thioesterase [Leptospiraceae bacterium]HMX34739.1 PaaI family thioesterase [Leptospiraceae bacterium]HMY30320.1 PaaI family thioesterase [Leptospiraceae bacterium]HMZ63673.1 PaaI family thioesterase [Leptospiraceae bacterium]
MNEEELHNVGPSLIGQDWHHTNCFGCGPDNSRGLHADFPFDAQAGEVRFKFVFEKFYEGAPGFVHGGILASLLDEAQGVMCFHAGHFVMTDQLFVKYDKACPLEEEVECRAWITIAKNRRLYTKATIHSPTTGEIYAHSKARWYNMKEKVFMKMFHRSPLRMERLKHILDLNKKRGKEIRKKIKSQKHS